MSLGAGREEAERGKRAPAGQVGMACADRVSHRWFHQDRDRVTRSAWSQGLRRTCQVGSRLQPGFRLAHQPPTPGLRWVRPPLAGQWMQGSGTSGLQVPGSS